MPCALPTNGFVLPSNAAIAEVLIELFDNFIIGMSIRVAVNYHLSPEDQSDMRQYFYWKLLKVDWKSVFRKNTDWIRNLPQHSRNYSASEVAHICRNYAKTILQNAVTEALWTAKSSGLTGLGLYKTKIADLPVGEEPVEVGANGQASRTAANQVAQIAKEMLEPLEWECIRLSFGFDGGGNRTPIQVARDANLPRKQVQALLDSAMVKLRVRVQ